MQNAIEAVDFSPASHASTRWIKRLNVFFFFLSTLLCTISIGVLDWFATTHIREWKDPVFLFDPRDASMPTLRNLALWDQYEQRFSVHGRVGELQEERFTMFEEDVAEDGSNKWQEVLSFHCSQTLESNVWLGTRGVSCSSDLDSKRDALVAQGVYATASRLCETMCDIAGNKMVYTCDKLKDYADFTEGSDLSAGWEHKTVCETSKAVGAMMIVAMMLGVAGIAMSTCCLHYPRVLFFPAGLAAFLILVSVTVFASTVSTTYPRDALFVSEVIAEEYYGADSADSDVAGIRSGFALAISSAVLSVVLCIIMAYRVRTQKHDDNIERELTVLSGIVLPVQESEPRAAASESRGLPDPSAPDLESGAAREGSDVAAASPRAGEGVSSSPRGDAASGPTPDAPGAASMRVAGSFRKRLEDPAAGGEPSPQAGAAATESS